MGLRGMVLSATAAAIGAIMYWAIANQGPGVGLSTAAIALIIVGALGFIVSATIFMDARDPRRTSRTSTNCEAADAPPILSAVHEDSTS
jgi:hypothetical protein